MTYTPPHGWVEASGDPDADPPRLRFHTRTDCPRVRDTGQLRPVDRPYSATRCPGCADAFGNDLERGRTRN
jgi:hypothetical protein